MDISISSPTKSSRRAMRRLVIAAFAAGLAVGGAFAAVQALAAGPGGAHGVPVAAADSLPRPADLRAVETPASFADLAAAVRPAVVGIRVVGRRGADMLTLGRSRGMPSAPGSPLDEFLRRFFPGQMPRGELQQGPEFEALGSGFIIDPQGLVVTNHHVVADAEKIKVILDDGRELEAKLRGSDAKTELALLEVQADKPLPFVRFGDSDAARIGDWVVAVGNPFGLGGTFTAGIISARGRDIQSGPFDDFLQVDAPINRGNSGGPLFNTRGEVIGINTAIFSPNGGNVGIGFAIPAEMAQPIVGQLRDQGRVVRAFLGVTIQTVDRELADTLGLEQAQGALVASVMPDSPAAEAGLEPGDVILALDGDGVEGSRDLARHVAMVTPGSRTKVRIIRDGEQKTLEATLETQNGEQVAATAPEDRHGLGVQLVPAEDGRGVRIAGVVPQSPAAREGLRPGDRILRVGRNAVHQPAEVAEAVRKAGERGDDRLLLLVERGGNARFLAVELG